MHRLNVENIMRRHMKCKVLVSLVKVKTHAEGRSKKYTLITVLFMDRRANGKGSTCNKSLVLVSQNEDQRNEQTQNVEI